MHVEYLADHPALIPGLARLHQAQWGYLRPERTLEERTRKLEASCGRGVVPTIVVALEDGALCGSAMLIASDMDSRPELTPWLAGVYVVEECRGRGYGSNLVRRIEAEAAGLGLRRIHLYTPDAEDFYVRLGWSVLDRCEHLGHEVTVMTYELGATPSKR